MQDARKTGFVSQGGMLFQMILDDLCLKYSLKINLKPFNLILAPIPSPPFVGSMAGAGPYPLPADYLRMAQDEVNFNFGGSPQKMVNVDLADIDFLGILPTNANFPNVFATDLATSPPSFYCWPPPSSGVISVNIRYYKMQAPILPSPQTSTTPPWFQDAMYLKTRLTGELLKPGAAAEPFLEKEAPALLAQYLKMEDDSEGRATLVRLDERQFGKGGRGYGNLPRTKTFDF